MAAKVPDYLDKFKVPLEIVDKIVSKPRTGEFPISIVSGLRRKLLLMYILILTFLDMEHSFGMNDC
jgi:hypothetical protein